MRKSEYKGREMYDKNRLNRGVGNRRKESRVNSVKNLNADPRLPINRLLQRTHRNHCFLRAALCLVSQPQFAVKGEVGTAFGTFVCLCLFLLSLPRVSGSVVFCGNGVSTRVNGV